MRKPKMQSQPEHSVWFCTYHKLGGRLFTAETAPTHPCAQGSSSARVSNEGHILH